MTRVKRKKIGIAFGSGGIRGVAHVGVIKALLEHDIPIDMVAGSSVGAWVAAHYALFQDLPELENKTIGHAKDKLMAMIEPTLGGGFIKGQKIHILLESWFKKMSFNDVKIPLSIVTTDLVTGNEVVFDQGDLITVVRASMAIPTMFKPVDYKHYQLADGGLVNPVPDDVVRKMGADIVIAVNLDNFEMAISKKTVLNSLAGISARSIQIMRHNLAKYSIKNADFIVEPLSEIVGLVGFKSFFDDKHKNNMVAEGYNKTLEIIPKLKKRL